MKAAVLALLVACAACAGSIEDAPVSPDGGAVTGATAGSTGGMPIPNGGCDDVFAQDRLTTWEIDIDPAEWAALERDMVERPAREAAVPPQDINPYHPLRSLRVGGETVGNVMIRLKGQSSWRLAVAGWQPGMPIPKMQFTIAFDKIDGAARFHGLKKVELDMPAIDASMLRQRLALAYLRDDLAIPAQCANSGRLVVNGAYYGLYTNLERADKSFLKRVFPDQWRGDLWDGGWELETNEDDMVDHPRQCLFWGLTLGDCGALPPAVIDADAMATLVDMDASMTEWAGEALLTNGDGFWGGRHNWFLYDHPVRGFIWIPHDLDATLSWVARTDVDPVLWWELIPVAGSADPHYLGVVNDPVWLPRYVDAIRRARAAYDAATMVSRLDAWAAQIADAAAADTHKPFTTATQAAAIATIRSNLMSRAAFIDRWLACVDGGGPDADADGAVWCRDCNDTDPTRAPGAPEICADGIDQNCNGLPDDGCPPSM